MKKRSPKHSAFPQDGPWLADDLVVWRVRKNQPCAMCKQPLKKQRRDLASMQHSSNRWFPTCLRCLHIDHLVFLPAGDSRVTRLASRLSSRRAVVMSTKYKTLRREGILVEIAALREACEKYQIELPPELKESASQQSTAARSQPAIAPATQHTTPSTPRPTPQKPTRRDTNRNYRFYETATPPTTPRPQTDAPPRLTAAPPSPKGTDKTYAKALSERIRDRYPRSPEPMIDEIARFAIQVYLPQHAENAQLPPVDDVDLGPLLTAFLRR